MGGIGVHDGNARQKRFHGSLSRRDEVEAAGEFLEGQAAVFDAAPSVVADVVPCSAGRVRTPGIVDSFRRCYSQGAMKDHVLIDERSLAFGRAVAARLADDPELMGRARATVVRWLATCSPHVHPALREWLVALDGPAEGVIALLTGRDERAVRLRQSNPFAGVLSQRERTAILRQFESYDTAAT